MPHLVLGNPDNAGQNTQFTYGAATRETAWQLYNSLYQGAAPADPDLATLVPAGLLNYSPFIANYNPVLFFPEDRNEKVVWPINANDAYTGLGPQPHPAQPTSVAEIKAFKTSWNKGSDTKPSVEENSISVHQRGYALTSGDSFKYFLNTQSMSPCITIIVWNRARQTAALAHVDKNQDFGATVTALFDRVTGTVAEPVRVHFHGGNCTYPQQVADPYTRRVEQVSSNTAVELLRAILGRNDTDTICISTFDVLARPHGNAVAFNTRNGQILPEIGEWTKIQLDTPFRYIQVKPTFAQRFPENFYAERGDRDALTQIADFNNGLGREATDVDTPNNPVSVAAVRAPRLQTDLRAVETARLPAGAPPAAAPIVAFLNQTKADLFTWAVRHTFNLPGAASNPPYSHNDLRAILMTAAGIQPAAPEITRLDQAFTLYAGLVKFENIIKKARPAAVPEIEWVPYLQTLSTEIRAGTSIEAVGKASAAWTKKYGFA